MSKERAEEKIYSPGQAKVLFDYWPKETRFFIVGGPADANEAQTVKARFPEVTCLGFEPNPSFLEEQKGRLSFPGNIYPYALWDSNMPMPLNVCGRLGRGSKLCCQSFGIVTQVVEEDKKREDGINVEARTLDSLSSELGPWEDIVLWLDIEFSELRALQGARELLSSTLLVNLEITNISSNLVKYEELMRSYNLVAVRQWNTHMQPDRADVIFKKRK